MRTLFSILLIITGSQAVIADEFIVDKVDCKSSNRYCDIQAAIDAASEGDVVVLAPGIYELWQESITIDKAITLRGASAQNTVLDGEGSAPSALINVTSEAGSVVIRNLTIANRIVAGSAAMGPGGLDHRGGDLTLDSVVFRDNRGGWGGAVRIDLLFGGVRISGARFTNNTGFAGGGLAVYNGSAVDLLIENSHFSSNNAIFSGGAVLMRDVAEVRLQNVEIRNNSAGNTGGGVHVFTDTGSSELIVRNSSIDGNEAAKVGGLSTFGSDISVTLEESEIAGNRSRNGLQTPDCSGPFTLIGNNTIGQQNLCRN